MYFFLSHWADNANDQTIQNAVGWERAVIGNILNLIRIVGVGIALIMLTYMSISYFTADGRSAPWSAERKADIKGDQLRNFVIGLVVFIGAGNIIYLITSIIIDLFS